MRDAGATASSDAGDVRLGLLIDASLHRYCFIRGTTGPVTVTPLPCASVPVKLVCAECSAAVALHQRDFSVIEPLAGTTMLRPVSCLRWSRRTCRPECESHFGSTGLHEEPDRRTTCSSSWRSSRRP